MSMTTRRRLASLRGAAIAAALCASAMFGAAPQAQEPSIAVPAFELNDLTLTPNNAQELERTASIAPLLRSRLSGEHGLSVVDMDAEKWAAADEGFGYLFEHHDVAAQLGLAAASDWIVVGRVHKASFLFVYLKAKLIDTRSARLVAELTVEIKGPQERMTHKGVDTLATQISEAIGKKTPAR